MRLGQLARKFDLTPKEIIDYLSSKGIEINTHPNSKLDEGVEAMLIEHYDVLPEVADINEELEASIIPVDAPEQSVEESEELPEESTTAEDSSPEPVVPETTAIATPKEEPATAAKDEVAPLQTDADEKVITSDTLFEMLENEDKEPELGDITLIKAPKKELEGLKVVGKIELPEPKKKEDAATEDRPAKKSREKQRGSKDPLTPEEREKRRQRIKENRRRYEERNARKKEEKEKRELKKRKSNHYKQKLQAIPSTPSKPKGKKKPVTSQHEQHDQPDPKTIFGKFWRWLNT